MNEARIRADKDHGACGLGHTAGWLERRPRILLRLMPAGSFIIKWPGSVGCQPVNTSCADGRAFHRNEPDLITLVGGGGRQSAVVHHHAFAGVVDDASAALRLTCFARERNDDRVVRG